MSYNTRLADRIREYLLNYPSLEIEEKEMFRGLTFMVNGKMCISVSGENLMCRFDPALQAEVAEKNGFLPMLMKGKVLQGYCYVSCEGVKATNDFARWIDFCLAFNPQAEASRKKQKA